MIKTLDDIKAERKVTKIDKRINENPHFTKATRRVGMLRFTIIVENYNLHLKQLIFP